MAERLPDADALLESLPCGVAVAAPDGTLRRVNQTLCAMLGYAREELVGQRKLQSLFTVGGRIFHQTHWVPMLQMQGSVSEVKFDLLHRDGHRLPMLLNAVRHGTAPDGHDLVTLTMAQERDKYEQELLLARRRADELLAKERDRALFAEQMVGIVSHDLRNPLAAILTGASVLGLGDDLSDMKTRALARVVSSTRRARRLIDELLDFTLARVGSGLPVARQPVALHALVARIVDELGPAFPGRALRHVAVGDGPCEADADRIAQLLGNLVGNAMAYGDAHAPVTVTSTLDGGRARIAVHNDGAPIPEALRATLFEPMVRGAPDDGASRSVGLGLFIVRAIAQAHGGEVHVASADGAGTTFEFVFGAGSDA